MDALTTRAKGGRMKRDASPKPRETETRPPEELFRILCGIYPLEVAQEIFEKLMEEVEKHDYKAE